MAKPASRGAEKKSAAWASHQEQVRKGFAARVAKRGAKDEPKGRASLPKDSRALGTAVGDAVEGAFVTALVAIEGAKAALLAAQRAANYPAQIEAMSARTSDGSSLRSVRPAARSERGELACSSKDRINWDSGLRELVANFAAAKISTGIAQEALEEPNLSASGKRRDNAETPAKEPQMELKASNRHHKQTNKRKHRNAHQNTF
jgi:hypothetical protein